MDAYDRLSAMDRSFLDLEGPNTHMHVAGAFVFEGAPLSDDAGRLDIDRIREYIESRLYRIPRYRQRIESIPIENHPVWVDDERFNIHYHVRHTSLPEPGDERQLKRLCGRILSQKLDRSKPLWEVWMVEGLEHGRIAMVNKTHHCMIDGLSGMDLLQVLLSPMPEKTFDRAPGWYPNPAPGPVRLVRDAIARRIQQPFEIGGAIARSVSDPGPVFDRVNQTLEALKATAATALRPASETPLNQPIGPHRRFDWLAVDLEEVKRVKQLLGGTVNDVVLATVAGAIGSFLTRRGVAVSKQRALDFRAFCPVSVRSNEERGTLGNRISGTILPLPIEELDAERRLARVSETMGNLKESKQALGADTLASATEWIAPTLVSLGARLAFGNRAANMVVTNVPGPQIPLYMLGARMVECYPMVPLFEGQGLGVALFSYAGGLFWGFNSDWDLTPDLHDFVVDVDRSFRQLCHAADIIADTR